MPKHAFGLAQVRMGTIESDGGMALTLVTIGETVSGTMVLTSEDNTVTDFNIEESSSPVESIVSQPGKVTLNWSSYDVSADNLVLFFGGTKVTGPPIKWKAPDSFIDVEKSLEVTDKKGNILRITRAKISAKFGLSFAKDKLGQVDLSATILQPTKVAEERFSIQYV
jgi:hypothetical protein